MPLTWLMIQPGNPSCLCVPVLEGSGCMTAHTPSHVTIIRPAIACNTLFTRRGTGGRYDRTMFGMIGDAIILNLHMGYRYLHISSDMVLPISRR